MKRLLSTVVALLFLVSARAVAETHVRVVLDTSGSMKNNDKDRLATLATLLLYDLVPKTKGLGDSFEILSFHPTQEWSDPSDSPPLGIGQRLNSGAGRAALASNLTKLLYNGKKTYFYPGLSQSIDELEATPGGRSDTRVLVLVTDGLPEELTRDKEQELIREKLLPRLESASIQLYVLAFGPQAFPNKGFFDDLVRGSGGRNLGEVFADPDGSRLLESMIRIFSRSFGYTQDAPRRVPVAGGLDLEGGRTPERAAVVLFWARPQPPVLTLTPPVQGKVHAPQGVSIGQETGASYQMLWALAPDSGRYEIAPTASGATVAVLRPSPVLLEVRPPVPGGRVGQVMAKKQFQLHVLVRPTSGRGDPGEVALSYQVHGERAGAEYTWSGEEQAPSAADHGTVVPEGRFYSIYPTFPKEPEEGKDFYLGHLEVKAYNGQKLLASKVHRFEVYPYLEIAPTPSLGDAAYEGSGTVRALRRWERGCTTFGLEVTSGRLPHPGRPKYSLRAALPPTTSLTGALEGAWLMLDGRPLEVAGVPGPRGSVVADWTLGQGLSREDFLGEHELCIQVGKPTAGNPAKPYELPIGLTLLESPYDAFDVIQPFTLKVLIAPPTFWETWGARLALGALLLGLLAAFWYLRGRPDLVEDLQVAVGRVESRAPLAAQPLPERSPWTTLFGLIAERPILADAGRVRLGVVRPVNEGLFRFRPARGVSLQGQPGEVVETDRGWAALAAHRIYQMRTGKSEYLVRLEYR